MTKANRVHSTPPTNTPTETSRRSFIGRTLSALVAGTALNVTAMAATRATAAATPIEEDPAIIALGERIDSLLDTYRNVLARQRDALSHAEGMCPEVPEEIVCKGPQWNGCTERERDVEDKDVWPAEYVDADGKTCVTPPRLIFNSKRAKAAIARGNLHCDRRTSFGKRTVKMIEAAERYEAGREKALERAGLPDAKTELYWAADNLQRLAYEAAEIKPRTMAGVLVQARALNAYAEAEIELDHFRGRSGMVVGIALAQSVSRIVAVA